MIKYILYFFFFFNLEHKISIIAKRIPNWSDIINKYNKTLSNKGEYKPTDCEPLQSVAIIVPYMKRNSHLKLLVNHLHYILPRQKIHYRIFVVEQNSPSIFNKAAIMNIGFIEAGKLFNFDCSIFHDVDMLAEDGRNMYNCLYSPRHIGSHVDKYGYRLFYNELVGGALAISPDHFRLVNGYSTSFYGWGGEDDDMKNRFCIFKNIYKIILVFQNFFLILFFCLFFSLYLSLSFYVHKK